METEDVMQPRQLGDVGPSDGHRLPPGPAGEFWFGSIGELRANPMDFYTRVSQEYGGMACFRYGRKVTYLVSTPDLIKEFLVTNRKRYIKNERYQALQDLIGEGLLLSEGTLWRRQRRATLPGFTHGAIKLGVERMVELIDECLDTWQPFAEAPGPVDIEPAFSVISQMLIGEWLLGPEHRSITDRVIANQADLIRLWPKPPTGKFDLGLPSPGRVRGLKQCLAVLDQCFFDAIRAERAKPSESGSLLSILCRHEDKEGTFDDQSVRDQLITLYMAGFETSASTTTWLFYRLSLQPGIREQLYQNVAEVLGGAAPTAEDLPALDLSERVVRETLRIYPPAYNFSRVAIEDDVLGGYTIPKGSMVIVAPWASHRMSEVWPNPEGFDPDRFLPERSANRSQFAWIPFGAGQRACIGASLAMAQATIITTRVAQRYVLDLAAGHRVEHVPGTVMRPRYGMRMTVKPLEAS